MNDLSTAPASDPGALGDARQDTIRIRGARQNTLKNLQVEIPTGELIVVTGPSGSGKSSLVFDTLYAEGQRRYVETFSPYARQFLDRMDKPQVDSIEGIPPAIAIEQRNTVKSTRSTVGTLTEICDYSRLLWSHLARLHCRNCGRPVQKDSPQNIWTAISAAALGGRRNPSDPVQNGDVLITFQVPLSGKLSLDESLALISKQGYQRLLIEHQSVRLEEAKDQLARKKTFSLCVVQDRLPVKPSNRSRFVEAC